MSAELQRLLDSEAAREALFEQQPTDDLVRFLSRVGAYAVGVEDPSDPQNTYGMGGGRMKREAVPLDATMPFEEYRHLMDRGEPARVLVAKHPSTPAQALCELAADPAPSIARAVLARNDLSAEVIDVLSDHPDVRVRLAVARRPDIDLGLFLQLARELVNIESTARSLEEDPRLTPELRALLPPPKPPPKPPRKRADRDRALRDASYRATMLNEDSDAAEFLRGMGALGSPSRTLVFNHYADLMTKGDYARTLIARHPSTPEHRLIELIESGSEEVQLAVLDNDERCTPAVREVAMKSEHASVREKATR